MIRLLIVDDSALMRRLIGEVFRAEGDFETAFARDGDEALVALASFQPDVVTLDVQMPRLDGLDAARLILAMPRRPRVIMLTTFDLDEYVYAAMRAGASGFLIKDTPRDQLVAAVRTVSEGDALLSSAVARRLVNRFARPERVRAPRQPVVPALSARETDVWYALARGKSNAEIAAELHLAEATVKTHVARVLAKLGLRDRTQAVIAAYEAGLIEPGHAPGTSLP